MATLALFVALGGSSYAALRVTSRNVPKDALTGADIKNLTGKDVKNNSLTGADVKNLGSGDVANGKLLAKDFAPGQLPAGQRGPEGPANPNADKLDNKDSSAFASNYFGRIDTLPNNSLVGFGDPVGTTTFDTADAHKHLSPNRALVARDLSVKLTAAPGSISAARLFVLRVNGADTSVTCTVSGTSATTCDSGAATAAIPPGSELSIKQAGNNSPAAANALFGWSTIAP